MTQLCLTPSLNPNRCVGQKAGTTQAQPKSAVPEPQVDATPMLGFGLRLGPSLGPERLNPSPSALAATISGTAFATLTVSTTISMTVTLTLSVLIDCDANLRSIGGQMQRHREAQRGARGYFVVQSNQKQAPTPTITSIQPEP